MTLDERIFETGFLFFSCSRSRASWCATQCDRTERQQRQRPHFLLQRTGTCHCNEFERFVPALVVHCMSKGLTYPTTPTGMSSGLLYELENEIVITSFAERGAPSPSIAFSRQNGSMTSSLHAELPQNCRPSSVFFGLLGLLHLRTGQHLRHTSHITRHTSHVTRHTSHVTRHTSHVTPHTSHITPHTLRREQARTLPSSLPKRKWRHCGLAM